MSGERPALVITVRPEPRVSREWGTFDALLYNLMTMNLAVMFTVPFLAAAAFYPRGSLPLAILIAGVFCCGQAMVYAFLASSMPKSGGDYYFQSRLVARGVGTVFSFTGVVLGGALWMAIAGWFAAHVAVSPLLSVLGRLVGSDWLLEAAAFVRSAHGVLVLSLAVISWSAIVNAGGMRAYARLQRIFWAIGVAGVIIIALLLSLFGASALGSESLYVEALARSKQMGFVPDGGPGVLASTMALVPMAAFSLIYPAWSVQQAGEVRRADRLGAQVVTIVLAEAVTVAVSAAVVTVVLANVDRDGLAAAAYLFFTDRAVMPDPNVPFFWFFDGGFWPSGFAALALAIVFNAWFWMWAPDITLAASRVMLAMSSDRSLPRWVGDLRERGRAPVKAIMLFSAVCVVPAVLYAYTTLWRLTLASTLLNVLAFAVTCAAAAFLPYLRRELYRDSTAARFELFRVPLITWLGGAFCAFAAFVVWRFATDSSLALGVEKWVLLTFVATTYLIAYLVHVLVGSVRRRRETPELEITYRRID